MPLKIKKEMFAPCGMDCMVCYKHCYTKKTKQPCAGCLAGDDGKPGHCRQCKIKDCVNEKGFSYCYECGDFPCKIIKNLEKSYNKRYGVSLVKNSIDVKEAGLSSFMASERRKWQCGNCGGVISLHDKICSECEKTI